MQSAWKTATGLLRIEPLVDLLGERHRIIAANWQNATLNVIIGALLRRAVEILEVVDFTAAAIRADLTDKLLVPRYLYSAAELIDRAANLLAEGAVLVHDSDRRWRVFHERVEARAVGTNVLSESASDRRKSESRQRRPPFDIQGRALAGAESKSLWGLHHSSPGRSSSRRLGNDLP
ncbi:MAG TPA: hypothetical protein VHK22_07715 [Gaiellaceae bacterium]|jgi:hypothetical protein|nr:hypothetical protein [Gaiellaceae bacterium]